MMVRRRLAVAMTTLAAVLPIAVPVPIRASQRAGTSTLPLAAIPVRESAIRVPYVVRGDVLFRVSDLLALAGARTRGEKRKRAASRAASWFAHWVHNVARNAGDGWSAKSGGLG